MSEPKEQRAANEAETQLLKGLNHLEKVAKAQITGRLEGKSDKGVWSYNEEPVEPADKDSDVSGDAGEEELEGKRSDTDYKPKNSFKRGLDSKADLKKGDDDKDDDNKRDRDDEEDDGDGDEDDDGEAEYKSLTKGSKKIRRAVEVSPFLQEVVRGIAKSLASIERRIVRNVGSRLERSLAVQREFNKSLADAMSGLGAIALEQGDLVKAIASAPARGVKSQLAAARPIQKSFDAGGADESVGMPDGTTLPQLDKSVVMQRLMRGAMKGLIPAGEVVKFDSTGIVNPALYKSLCTNKDFLE